MRCTAGRSNGRRVSSVMAAWRFRCSGGKTLGNEFLPDPNDLRHVRHHILSPSGIKRASRVQDQGLPETGEGYLQCGSVGAGELLPDRWRREVLVNWSWFDGMSMGPLSQCESGSRVATASWNILRAPSSETLPSGSTKRKRAQCFIQASSFRYDSSCLAVTEL